MGGEEGRGEGEERERKYRCSLHPSILIISFDSAWCNSIGSVPVCLLYVY